MLRMTPHRCQILLCFWMIGAADRPRPFSVALHFGKYLYLKLPKGHGMQHVEALVDAGYLEMAGTKTVSGPKITRTTKYYRITIAGLNCLHDIDAHAKRLQKVALKQYKTLHKSK